MKPKQPVKNYKHTHKLQMQLEPGLGASYTIRPGNGVGLFYSSYTHPDSLYRVYHMDAES